MISEEKKRITGETKKKKTEKEQIKIPLNNFRIFQILLSEYSFLIIIFILLIILKNIPIYHYPQKFKSKPKKEWNSNYVPLIFSHITDVHISSFKSSKTDCSLIYLEEFFNKYKPDFILSTGDIVDNYETMYKFTKLGSQSLLEWELYNKTLKRILDKYYVIDVAGNHDVFAVDDVISKNNNFLDYSYMFTRENVKSYEDFVVKKHIYKNLTFILFNDYIFPTTHPPYGLTAHPSKYMLDLLENMIDSVEDECIILSHYQVDRFWFAKSSKGHTYREIISKPNVKAYFSGHYHPKKPVIIHHGKGAVEYCTSSTFNHKKQGLITYDNDQLVYHSVHIPYPNYSPYFFISYPIPDDQCSSHHNFNYDNSEVRVISYKKGVKLFIEGDLKGELQYKMTLDNGAELYTFPINLKKGKYKIHVYGDECDIKISFVIGDECKGKKELFLHVKFMFSYTLGSIPLIIIVYIIIFPYYFTNLKKAEEIELYLEGSNNIKINYLYIYLIILSPFIIRVRYSKINKKIRYIIFYLSFYPVFLPNNFFKNIYGIKGFSFNAFIVIGNRIQFDEWALIISFLFYILILLQDVLYLSCKKYYYNLIIFLCNILSLLISFILIQYFNLRYLGESIQRQYLIITPSFCILWLIFKIIIFKFAYIENYQKLN